MSLKEKTMIVQLNTSHWTARKFDKKVTEEIDETHEAHQAGRFNKTLIISDLLKDVQTCVSKARAYHYKVKIKWDDAGQRLLPIELYFEYTKKMEEFRNEHKNLVTIFLREYPDLREKAKERLNTLFNEADYPDAETLTHKFNISYKLTPVSDSEDLRIKLSKDEMKQIKNNIQNSLSEKINNAKNNIISKAETSVKAMYERLKDNEATFRDSLVGNIVSLKEIIPSMNFDNDQNLASLEKLLNKLNVKPDKLRKDVELRERTAKKAKKILIKIHKMYYGETESIVEEIKPEKKKKKNKKKIKRIKK